MKKKKEMKEVRFWGLKKSQFVVEVKDHKHFYHHEANAKHGDITVCKVLFAFPTKRLSPLGVVTPELAKLVENRYKGVKFNGKYGPASAFLFEVKYKAEVSKDDTPNELVGKDVAYSKCVERAYKTAAGIASLISIALVKQLRYNDNVIDFLDIGAERENNWRKSI